MLRRESVALFTSVCSWTPMQLGSRSLEQVQATVGRIGRVSGITRPRCEALVVESEEAPSHGGESGYRGEEREGGNRDWA